MVNDFQSMVTAELRKAREKFKPINSGHEGYAVILEELQEFWDHCQKWKGGKFKAAALKELIQIAAMAQRVAEDLKLIKKQKCQVCNDLPPDPWEMGPCQGCGKVWKWRPPPTTEGGDS